MISLLDLLNRESLLHHPVRHALVELSRREPGIAVTGFLRQLKHEAAYASLGYGTLTHHLYLLERAGVVTSRRSGRNRRYYVARGPLGDPTVLSILQRPGMLPVAEGLIRLGESSQKTIWQAVAAHHAVGRHAVAYHLAKLEAAGLAVSARLGRARTYRPTPLLDRGLRTLASVNSPGVSAPGTTLSSDAKPSSENERLAAPVL